MRIGHGYDAHRLVKDRKLILCGVDIPFDLGLDGHSDADVAVHALIDAILGAAALGDIGKMFPDNDDNWLNADSIELLKIVNTEIIKRGHSVINCDITIIAQKPKLSSYIEEMRTNIADALSVPVSDISVKATTEEKMGFTGSLEGISAHSVVLLN